MPTKKTKKVKSHAEVKEKLAAKNPKATLVKGGEGNSFKVGKKIRRVE